MSKDEGIYEINLSLKDRAPLVFRTDEWNEIIILERLAASGQEVLKIDRKLV